ncbi:MAG TPA: A/G-specific adenine glycosylase [Terriglobales bacterium]|nr:A/G-specific adenine glycosylase [Terriglobales bacterium]
MKSTARLRYPGGSREFSRLLLRWYDREKRSLPWRGEKDPYRILVSEIMLQQTRVAVVEGRYRKFIQQFPTALRLARAKEQTVLAAWSGLGYYRRARALHAAAKAVTRSGAFPQTAVQLEGLPGVGRYTAAAVASIAFGELVPVVDGNVKRVLQRLLGREPAKEEYWSAAGEMLDRERPGDFNQAMMELGALVCLPGAPLCEKCPVARLCQARGAGVRRKQASRRKAVLVYALALREGKVLLRQRSRRSPLMAGMWELPECETQNVTPIMRLRHSITTTDYSVSVFAGRGRVKGEWVSMRSVERIALTGLARKILRKARALQLTTRKAAR